MYRVVLFAMTVLILLLIDVTGVGIAATNGALALAVALAVLGLGLLLALVVVRFDTRRRPYWRWPHRGATRAGYNPWLGGGIDDER